MVTELTWEDLKKNEKFWKRLKYSCEIPIMQLVEKDPYCIIVGKKKEIEMHKKNAVKTNKIQAQIEKRYLDLVFLEMEIELLKKRGYGELIEEREKLLIDKEKSDWEKAHKEIIEELKAKGYDGGYRLEIKEKWPEIVLSLYIDWKKIYLKMIDELPSPVVTSQIGPRGGGKSLIQRQTEKFQKINAAELGVRGWDTVAIRDIIYKNKPEIVLLPGGDGILLEERCRRAEERRQRRNKLLKWGTPLGVMLAGVGGFAYVIGGALAQIPWGLGIGVNPLLDVAWWIYMNKDFVVKLGGLFVGLGLYHEYRERARRAKSNIPRVISSIRDRPPHYVGNISPLKLQGGYRFDKDLPPQEFIDPLPQILAANGRSVIIEDMSEQENDTQSLWGNVIQQHEVDIANRGEYKIPWFGHIMVGANPDQAHRIKAPLRDRLLYGDSKYVTTEVEEYLEELKVGTERSSDTEKQSIAFMEYVSQLYKGPFFERSGFEEGIRIENRLADEKNQLAINRRFLAILIKAMDYAEEDKSRCVYGRHMKRAEMEARSVIEQLLKNRIYKQPELLGLNFEGEEIGKATIVPLARDESLITEIDGRMKTMVYKGPLAGMDKEILEMSEEDSVGYVTSVAARVYDGGEKEAGLKIISKLGKEYEEYYGKVVEALLRKYNFPLSEKHVEIDLTRVMNPDDVIPLGALVAIISDWKKKPVRQDIGIMVSCGADGSLVPVSKPNKRVYDVGNKLRSLVILQYDCDKRIEESYYPEIDFVKGRNCDDVLKKIFGL